MVNSTISQLLSRGISFLFFRFFLKIVLYNILLFYLLLGILLIAKANKAKKLTSKTLYFASNVFFSYVITRKSFLHNTGLDGDGVGTWYNIYTADFKVWQRVETMLKKLVTFNRRTLKHFSQLSDIGKENLVLPLQLCNSLNI